jgi:hypothetical protein
MKQLVSILAILLLSAGTVSATCEDTLMGSGFNAEQATAACNPTGTLAAEDVTVSDDLTVTDDVDISGALTLDIGTIAAAGTNLATATAIANQLTIVTACDNTKGIALPDAVVGSLYLIHATGTGTCALYAAGSSTINATAGATGETLGLEELAICVASATDTYFCGVGVDF